MRNHTRRLASMTMHRYLTVVLAGLALGFLASGVHAGTVAAKTDPDAEFAKNAIQKGMAEIAFGQLAPQRAGNPRVKQLAQHIVEDHVRLDDELMDLVRNETFNETFEAPKELDPEHNVTKARLSVLTGAAFDHEYLDAILKDYVRYITFIREYAQHGKNTSLTSWAARTLVMLRNNQQLASVTAQEIKAP
jgi:putative membrane protein